MNTELSMSNSCCQSSLSASPSPILPDDLIVEILSFLKVKPLMKMKCVSKRWNTLISDPTFVKMHLNRSSQNSHSYLVSTHTNDYSFIPFSVNDLMENCTINLPCDPYYCLIDRDCRKVVGSCNGLVCLSGYSFNEENHEKEKWLRIWNPATRTISDKLLYLNQLKFWKFVFGYDNSTDTYKILALHLGHDMTTTEVQVLSFGNNVWRNIQSFPARLMINVPFTRCVHLDYTLNWLATIKNGNLDTQFVIISFDLRTETHTQLLPPPTALNWHPTTLNWHVQKGVCVLMDSLCFFHDFQGTDLVIWKMTKFGDEKSWTQFLKLNYHNLRIESKYRCVDLYVNGDILVFLEYPKRRAILYNWRNSTVVKTRVDKRINWFSINNYVESLVSTF